MPNYEPEPWNDTNERRQANNCYSYATNNMKDPPVGSSPPKRLPEPGKKSSKRIRRFIEQIRADVDGQVQQLTIVQIACRTADHAGQSDNPDPAENTDADVRAEYQRPLVGVCEAVLADGLHEEGHCATDANCWRVAVLVRSQQLNPTNPPLADFHFVREDTLPDGNKKWSHKPGPEPVTDQKYNPSTEKWDGGPITDPRNDKVGPGDFRFCCFVCCCPSTEIAELRRERPRRAQEYVAFVSGDSMGVIAHTVVGLRSRTVFSAVEAARSSVHEAWRSGVGDGRLVSQLYCPVAAETIVVSVTDRTVTLWDPQPRHYVDTTSATAQRLRRYLYLWS